NLQGTELAILSACDTGSGAVKIGEGVMSQRRVFRIAGAETVLASHGKVNDKATTQLMTQYTRRRRSGEPRGLAGGEARLCLLHVGVGGQLAVAVVAGEFPHAVVERVETGEGDELEFVAHGAEFVLEPGDGGLVEVLFPVEGRGTVVGEQFVGITRLYRFSES